MQSQCADRICSLRVAATVWWLRYPVNRCRTGYDDSMNLLSLILIAMGIIVGLCVFYAAWELSSGRYEPGTQGLVDKKGADESKESQRDVT